MNGNRWLYRVKGGGHTIREYLRGDYYAEYEGNHVIAGWYVSCKDSTMKAWGRRITEEEAKEINPNLDALKQQALNKLEEALAEQRAEHEQLAETLREITLSSLTEAELEAELVKRRG